MAETNSYLDKLNRSINDKSDLYIVSTGPKETRGWGAVAISHFETELGQPVCPTELASRFRSYAGLDPQPPQLLSYAELSERIFACEAAAEEMRRQETDEFDALIGMSIPGSAE